MVTLPELLKTLVEAEGSDLLAFMATRSQPAMRIAALDTVVKQLTAAGFALSAPDLLQVAWLPGTDTGLSANTRKLIAQSIAQDPRPAYQNIPERVYVMSVAGYEIKFQIEEKAATIIAVEPQAV